jgi:uncharacterized protein YkwD
MFVRRALTFFLSLTLLAASHPLSSAYGGGVSNASKSALTAADLEEQLFEAINQERAARGLTPLRRAADLNAVAQSHSRDMLARDYFDHRTPEGLGLKERVERGQVAGWRRVAENISSSRSCARFDAVRMAVAGWMNSPGHRQNILDKQMQETGIGVATDAEGKIYYVTQVYVARK